MFLFFLNLLKWTVCVSLKDWDFGGLTIANYYETTFSSYTYHFNFRKALVVNSSIDCVNPECVLEEIGNAHCYCYGNLSTEAFVIHPDEEGINFTYKSNTPTGTNSTGTIILRCSDSLNYSVGFNNYDVWVNLNAAQGCKVNFSKKKMNRGLSWGGVFCIVLLSIIFLYFSVGIPFQIFVRHRQGIDMFIGVTYITSFFYLTFLGVKFLVGLLVEQFSGGKHRRNGYESL